MSSGYKTLSLKNPDRLIVHRLPNGTYVAMAVSVNTTTPEYYLGGTVSCPPHCPGVAFSKGVHGGVFVTQPCPGFVNGPACLHAHTSRTCGVWNAQFTSCDRCPVGAVCPGGQRMWAQAGGDPPISARFTVFLLKNVSGGCFSGYWCGDEFSGRVVECAPPQTARCRGWSTNRGLTVCGPCYLQSSPKCSRCANSCFENFGACYPCQFRADLPPFVAVAVSFAPVLATVAGFGLLHMFAMAISSRPRSPKRRNMARRAVLQGVGPLLVRLGRYSFC
jgi:hypothetical protein